MIFIKIFSEEAIAYALKTATTCFLNSSTSEKLSFYLKNKFSFLVRIIMLLLIFLHVFLNHHHQYSTMLHFLPMASSQLRPIDSFEWGKLIVIEIIYK